MALTAASVIQDMKILLNDPNGTAYTTAKLLPHLNRAYKTLQAKMRVSGMQSGREVSAEITVSAGTTRLGDAAGLPNDFVAPVAFYVRSSSSERWREIFEKSWEDISDPTSRIEGWAYREDEIKFKAATSTQYVLLKYIKSFQVIDEDTDPILVLGADLYLAAKGAAYAAMFIGENQTRAAVLDAEAAKHWEDFRGLGVKQGQRIPARRRVNRFRV
jgi:hypothetical protein